MASISPPRGLRLLPHAVIPLVLAVAGHASPRVQAGESPGAAESPGSAASEFLKINYVFNRGLYEIAVPRYLALLEKHPDFDRASTVHYALAVAYRSLATATSGASEGSAPPADAERRGHLESSQRHARLALEDRELAARDDALEILGLDLLDLGDLTTAAKAFRALVKRTDGARKGAAALSLGDTYYAGKSLVRAEAAYRQAMELLDPKAAGGEAERAAYQLALTLFQRGGESLAEAARLFERLAREGGPLAADSRYMEALCHRKAGAAERALTAFRQLGASGPAERKDAALLGEGRTLFELGRQAEAAEVLGRLVTEHPTSAWRDEAKLWRARALLGSGQAKAGARLLADLRSSPRVGAEASLWLARAYAERERHEPAIRILEAALESFPESPFAETLELEIVVERISAGQAPAAIEALEGFRSRHPESDSLDHAAYLEAFALHRSGDLARSAEACRQFLAKYPESRYRRDARWIEAENAFLDGRHDDAIRLYASIETDFGDDLSAEDRLLARYRQAEARLLSGDYEAATRELDGLVSGPGSAARRELLASRPVFASYRYLRGEAAYQAGDHARAIRELRAYLSGDGSGEQRGQALLKLAHSLEASGDGKAADEAYREALDATEDGDTRGRIRFELGQLAMQRGDNEAAAAAFRQVVEESPGSALAPHACHFLGWIAQEGGRGAEAIEWYTKLVDAPEGESDLRSEGLYRLALALQSESRFDEARRVLERLQTEYPGEDVVRKVRLQEAITLAREGETKKALAALESLEASSLPPDLAALLHYERAWCHRAVDAPDAARRDYSRLLELATEGKDLGAQRSLVPAARMELAELEFEAGRYAVARDRIAALLISPGGPLPDDLEERALYRLVWCRYREGDHEEIAKAYRVYRSTFPEGRRRAEIALLVARSRVEAREFAKAIPLFREVSESATEAADVELALVGEAECHNELRDFTKARELLLAAVEKHPEGKHRERAGFGLGWANEHLGRFDEAIERYRGVSGSGSEIAARAQFQIGQCLAAQKKYADAIVEFLQVPARYRFPSWSARATLQVAGCFEALENWSQARKHYREVASTWPDAAEAKLAADRLGRLPQ